MSVQMQTGSRPDFAQLVVRARYLHANPQEGKPGELEQLQKFIAQISQSQPQILQQQQHQPHLTNGHAPVSFNNASPAPPVQPAPSPQPVSFTPEQIGTLRAQIQAFKHLQQGTPVPEFLISAMKGVPATAELDKTLSQNGDIDRKIVDSAVKTAKAAEEVLVDQIDPKDLPKGPFLEEKVDSGIYPYNSYRHPYSHLIKPDGANPRLFQTRLQKLVIPTVMPAGLDPQVILVERDRFIDARVKQRISELEALPSTFGEQSLVSADGAKEEPQELEGGLQTLLGPSHSVNQLKLKSLIELKSLRLREKQRAMRGAVAETLVHGSLLPLNRGEFRRPRKVNLRDARSTEMAERKQRSERERRAKSKHVEQLGVILRHAHEVTSANKSKHSTVVRLKNAVAQFHRDTEKEEQARIERISKERIRALKANDEEAYMHLVDAAKDTRITHLLKQTDEFLSSLANAVRQQQAEGGSVGFIQEYDENPASEATFGATAVMNDDDDKSSKLDYYAIAHRVQEKITKQPNILVGGTLKDYQVKGLQWLVSLYNNRLNGILADEMGLGKTIQTISLITFLIDVKKQRGPYLVIVPLSTMTNWSGEFAKWAPSVKTISYKGNPSQRKVLQNELRGPFQVLLTTYEYIIKDRPILSKFRWLHMIMDEGHRMKNTNSKLAVTLTTYYHSRYRLLLTGTPLQNNLPELWALLNFVLPKIFNSVSSFDEWFNTPFASSGTGDKIELNEEEQLLIIRRLHKVLRPFLLRRLKKDVETELPDKVERVIKVRMSALQTQLYKQMKKYKMISDGGEKGGKGGGIKGLSNELMQLRKIVQHPFLFESVEDRINPSGVIDDKLIRTSGKIELLSKILPKFFRTGHRVLIFFQMTKVMDIMEDFLKMMNYQYLRLDGGTKTEERAQFVQLFNKQDSEYKVFILSTRAGGLGLNLQTADTVIIFDSDWNPHADLQAQDRAHRIGQTRAVLILRFITEKSVEEAMYQRARYKLDIDGKVIQAGRFDNKSTQQEQEDFLRSILEADQEEDNEESGDLNDDELNNILSRSDEEAVIFREMDIEREREAQERWLAAGHHGRPPPSLMPLEELPECYQSEEPFGMKDAVEIEMEGRGQRKRNVVSYTDGLDDDAWAMALEDGEDLTELSQKVRRGRPPKSLLTDTIDSARATPLSDDSRAAKKKGRGRPRNSDYEFGALTSGKRKRATKDMSVTPSLADDDEDDRDQKRRKTKGADLPAPVREKMKKAFNDCFKAVLACEDETGRKRCDMFKELPDKRDYPDYYQLIRQPIALNILKKRANSNHYKDVQAWKADWQLMFKNAWTYNQEGSWVYVDASEMEKVLNAAWDKYIVGSGLPGAPGGNGEASSSYSNGNGYAGMDEDDIIAPVSRGKRKQVVSDDEYLTPSDG